MKIENNFRLHSRLLSQKLFDHKFSPIFFLACRLAYDSVYLWLSVVIYYRTFDKSFYVIQ